MCSYTANSAGSYEGEQELIKEKEEQETAVEALIFMSKGVRVMSQPSSNIIWQEHIQSSAIW